MDTFIGFDIDHKHTQACVVQAGQHDRYKKLPTDVGQLREWLKEGALDKKSVFVWSRPIGSVQLPLGRRQMEYLG